MTYTLKVDWTGRRAQVVMDILADPAVPFFDPGILLYDPEHPDDVNTYKLDLSQDRLDQVEAALHTYVFATAPDLMPRARDNEPGLDYGDIVRRQAEAHAALHEIREYRESVREAVLAQGRDPDEVLRRGIRATRKQEQ